MDTLAVHVDPRRRSAGRWWPTARPETISHTAQERLPKIMPAVKGPKSVEEGIEWLKSFDIIVHPRCQHTIDEPTLYSYKTDPTTNKVLPILEDKHNHVIDALRYACEGARRANNTKPKVARPGRQRDAHRSAIVFRASSPYNSGKLSCEANPWRD